MKRLLILLLLFASALHAQQQNFPGGSGGGLTQVAVLPGTCNLGVLYQLTASPYGIFSCPQTNVLQKVDKGSSNTIDPVAFGVKGDGQLWIDGTTTNTSPNFSSASHNCAVSDVGKLLIAINSVTGAYLYGAGGAAIITVTACSGNSWVASGNANASVVGTAYWSIGTDNNPTGNPMLTNAYNAAIAANGILSMPCGVFLVSTPPFQFTGAVNQFMQRPDVQGCNSTGGTVFMLHPNVSAGVLGAGGNIFMTYGPSNSSGAPTYPGLGSGMAKAEDLALTSMSGNIPSTGGKVYTVFNNVTELNNIGIWGMISSTGALVLAEASGGEARFNLLNFQASNGAPAIYFSGQGINAASNMIIQGNTIATAASCQAGTTCVFNNDYITQTDQGIGGGAGSTVIIIGDSILVSGGSGSAGAIFDTSGATTFQIYGNPLLQTTAANYPAIGLNNAGSIADMSGDNVVCQTAGYCVLGAGTLIDRGGPVIFSSPLTQFAGKYVPMGGGSMATSFSATATNFGTAIGSTALVPTVLFTAPMNVYVSTRQSLLGVSCTAGSNTAQVTISYTAPGSTAETMAATTLTASANGALDTGSTASQVISFTPKIGTAVNYSVASVLASTGCSPVPQYTVDLRVQ